MRRTSGTSLPVSHLRPTQQPPTTGWCVMLPRPQRQLLRWLRHENQVLQWWLLVLWPSQAALPLVLYRGRAWMGRQGSEGNGGGQHRGEHRWPLWLALHLAHPSPWENTLPWLTSGSGIGPAPVANTDTVVVPAPGGHDGISIRPAPAAAATGCLQHSGRVYTGAAASRGPVAALWLMPFCCRRMMRGLKVHLSNLLTCKSHAPRRLDQLLRHLLL
mmetsp:Transcript_13233/g.40087  ORF Transcript_13233/g.40087 Transcript_13233/m.40087 type:complete len:216 (-) Transcript_13233:2236-2883(-)